MALCGRVDLVEEGVVDNSDDGLAVERETDRDAAHREAWTGRQSFSWASKRREEEEKGRRTVNKVGRSVDGINDPRRLGRELVLVAGGVRLFADELVIGVLCAQLLSDELLDGLVGLCDELEKERGRTTSARGGGRLRASGKDAHRWSSSSRRRRPDWRIY